MTTTNMVRELKAGKMTVAVYETRDDMGKAVARDCAAVARKMLAEKEEVNILFPCAYSHSDFFKYFFREEGVDWSRMNAFVMDEYLGLAEGSEYLLCNFARDNIFTKAPFKATYAMNGAAKDFQAECDRYAALLKEHPLDMACLGIGETGHLAYNDPAVADFNDPAMVKYVEIDEQSRHQGVHDGAFPTLESVPKYALTVTMPVMMNAPYKQLVCPTGFKKDAIRRTVYDEISTACPATVMRNYDVVLYTDVDAAADI